MSLFFLCVISNYLLEIIFFLAKYICNKFISWQSASENTLLLLLGFRTYSKNMFIFFLERYVIHYWIDNYFLLEYGKKIIKNYSTILWLLSSTSKKSSINLIASPLYIIYLFSLVSKAFCDFMIFSSHFTLLIQQSTYDSFFIYFFNWRIIASQNFVVFCLTSTWISHRQMWLFIFLGVCFLNLCIYFSYQF